MGFGQRLYSKVASVCSRWASYCAANQRNCLPSKPGSWSYPYVDVPMSPEARRAAGIDVDYAGEGILWQKQLILEIEIQILRIVV
jgi:hypothetical protein